MSTAVPVYDSAQRRRPFSELRHFLEYRSLIGLLVTRDLTMRYKRSVLGVWWTVLNPMLTVLVFWLVFSNIFGRQADGVPFIVYAATGILMAQFFSQGIIAAGSAIVNSRGILEKVRVPSEVFSLSAGAAAAVNFLFSLIPLVVIQLVTGTGLSYKFPLVIISTVAMLLLVTGVGLLLASIAVLFYDVFDLARVLTLLITYLSAPFYPLEIIPEKFQFVVTLNPIYHHIRVFRSFAYDGYFSWESFGVVVVSSAVLLTLGVWVFSRSWKNVVAAL